MPLLAGHDRDVAVGAAKEIDEVDAMDTMLEEAVAVVNTGETSLAPKILDLNILMPRLDLR